MSRNTMPFICQIGDNIVPLRRAAQAYPARHTTFVPPRRTANIPRESYPCRLRRSLLVARYTNRVP
jgi:hypothetical protein